MKQIGILAVGCFSMLAAFGYASPAASGRQVPSNQPAASTAVRGLPESSLYQLHSGWTTDAGVKMRLESLRGKLRVLTLFFGHCEASCPMVLSRLKTLDASLPADWGMRGGMVLISLDPERDDAESLAGFRRRMSLAPERWTILRGREEDTRELAMALGVTYRRSQANGGMDHNAVVVILDDEGRIVNRHEGAVDAKVLLEEYERLENAKRSSGVAGGARIKID